MVVGTCRGRITYGEKPSGYMPGFGTLRNLNPSGDEPTRGSLQPAPASPRTVRPDSASDSRPSAATSPFSCLNPFPFSFGALSPSAAKCASAELRSGAAMP